MKKTLFYLMMVAACFVLLLGMVCSTAGCGMVEATAKKDVFTQKAPTADKNMLSGAKIRTEGAKKIIIGGAEGVSITGSDDSYDDDGKLIKGKPAKAEIIFDEMNSENKDAGGMQMTNEQAAFNLFRMMGMSPNQLMAMNQGIQAENTPFGDFWGGQQKGYGVLERLWDWLKQMFWIVIGIILLAASGIAVLCIIPATRPIGFWLLRLVASIIPGASAIVSPLLEKNQRDKYLSVVAGGENFKAGLEKLDLTAEQLESVKRLFREEQEKTQNTNVKDEIKKITA